MTGYDEALSWFRADPGRVRDLDDVDNRSAAITIVNAVLAGAVPAGRDLTAQDVRNVMPTREWGAAEIVAERLNRIARPSGGVGHPVGVSEAQPDEHRDWVPGVGRHDPMSQPPDEWLDYLDDLPGRSTVWSPDPSPRSWSLPAPPPDDVTVVHLRGDGMRCERKGEYWVNPYGGELTWGELFSDGFTVVEGEPPAPEPQEPPRFERGFYRLARDLENVDGTIRAGLVFVSEPDSVGEQWVGSEDVNGWVTAAALAAAGAERVEER